MQAIKIITDEDFGEELLENKNPKKRIGARGIIIDEDGNIAVFNKKNKNEYKLPGGGVDPNEDPSDAFCREVEEETGCKIEIIEQLGTIEEHKTHDNFLQVSYVFVGKVLEKSNHFNLTRKEKEEGGQVLWVSPEEAFELIQGCKSNLKASRYENLYHSKFIVLRDETILKYYLENR